MSSANDSIKHDKGLRHSTKQFYSLHLNIRLSRYIDVKKNLNELLKMYISRGTTFLYTMTCAPSEDSDHPAQFRQSIRRAPWVAIFAGRMRNLVENTVTRSYVNKISVET